MGRIAIHMTIAPSRKFTMSAIRSNIFGLNAQRCVHTAVPNIIMCGIAWTSVMESGASKKKVRRLTNGHGHTKNHFGPILKLPRQVKSYDGALKAAQVTMACYLSILRPL